MGVWGARGLAYLDHESSGDSARKATPKGKKRRKELRQKRSGATAQADAADGEQYGHSAAFEELSRGEPIEPPAEAAAAASYTGSLDAAVSLPRTCVICAWDLELTGGRKIYEQEIFDLGADVGQWRDGGLVKHDEYGSLVHSTQGMSTYVHENIAAPAGVTAAKLLAALPLSEVVDIWLDICEVEADEGAEDEAEVLPVVLAGHGAHAVDFPATYWSMMRAGLDAYQLLTEAGVIGVLDTYKLAKQLALPPAVLARLDKTDTGNESYSNSSLYKALLPKAPRFNAHRALPDATATAAVLGTREMSALLRRANLGGALISLDQLVLKAHADYNKQFAEAGAAHTKKRVCRYCNGAEQPYTTSHGPGAQCACVRRPPLQRSEVCTVQCVRCAAVHLKNVCSNMLSHYHTGCRDPHT